MTVMRWLRGIAFSLAALASCASPAGAQENGGRVPDPPQDSAAPPAQKNGEDARPSLGPDTARATAEAARRYAEIADAGGWPRVGKPLRPGAEGKAVATLRRRLAAEGALPPEAAEGIKWDDRLTAAIEKFQARVGLPQTGTVSGQTLRELNVPAKIRARQLAVTAKRLERLRFRFGPHFVSVNIPGAFVELVEDGKKVHSYTAIVGDRKHPSPELGAKIVSVDLNPTWTVPLSIIQKELVPKIRKDRNYLSRDHIRVFDGRGREIDPRKVRWSKERAANYTFRQDPGEKNSLGSIRLFMPNRHAVFLHDTPRKTLFDRSYRFLSHGCVRVEGVYDLAARLLKEADSKHWDEAALARKIDSGDSEKIRLRRPVPVVWAYMTGWATPDGSAHFRRDIYGMDKEGAARKKR